LAAYQAWLQDQIVATAEAALRDLAPAELSFGSGMALFVVNRREPTPQGIKLGFDPRGVADRTVPVLRITAPDGRLRGIVFGAACHPTTIPPRENAVNGDYPGYAQAQLEAAHAGAQAMFVQGFAGAAGPYPTGRVEYARQHGLALAAEVDRVLGETKLVPLRGPLRAVQLSSRLPLDPPKTLAEIEAMARSPQAWLKYAASRMLVRWHEGIRPLTEYETPFTVWQFGDDLTLAALPGEVVTDYALRLTEALGPLRLWLAAYSNDVFGYLPSARMLREGGYETRGVYSGEKFAPEVEEQVVDHMVKLAREAGRIPPPVPAR
jgi:neutral ceramidase